MGRIDAEIPDDLEQRLRIEVVKRYGGRKGDLLKAIIEAVTLWVNMPIAQKLADAAKNNSNPTSVQSGALESLGKLGYAALPYLAEIANSSNLPSSIQIQALQISNTILSSKSSTQLDSSLLRD